jgi:hypothetical protein
MKIYTIGRNPSATIVLTSSMCSREHARISVETNGKILLEDFSSNGTTVNGKKIQQQRVEVGYGDEVFFGGVEKLDWAKIEKPIETKPESKFEEKPEIKNEKKRVFFSYQTIVFSLIGIGVVSLILFLSNRPIDEKPFAPSDIYNRYKSTVALVEVRYYVRVKTTASDLYFGIDEDGDITHSGDKSKLNPLTSEGTAFFIDSMGTLVTNRHVLEPWNSNEMSNFFYKRV